MSQMHGLSEAKMEPLELPGEVIIKILEYVLPPWHLCKYPARCHMTCPALRNSLDGFLSDLPGIHRTTALYPQQSVFLTCRKLSDTAKSTFWRSFTNYLHIHPRWLPDSQKDSEYGRFQYIASVLPRVTDLHLDAWLFQVGNLTELVNSMPCLRNVKICYYPLLRGRKDIDYSITEHAGIVWKPRRIASAFQQALSHIKLPCRTLDRKAIKLRVQFCAKLCSETEVAYTVFVVDMRFCANQATVVEKRVFEQVEDSLCVARDKPSEQSTRAYREIAPDTSWLREAVDLSAAIDRLVSSRPK